MAVNEKNNNSINNSDERVENERLRFALNAAGIGTWDLDPVSNKVVWDERCRELFGFAPGETEEYAQVLKYMYADDATYVNNAVQRALDPATEGEYEVRYRTQGANDGKLRWVLSKGKAYFTEDGKPYRFAGTAQDITESVLERERAEASEMLAQLALDNSDSGYFHLRLDTNEIDYSPGYARIITGVAKTGVDHSIFIKHVHRDDVHIRDAAQAVARQTGHLDYEARVVWKDGSIHWMRAKGTYLKNTSGEPYLLTGTIHDTTAEHTHAEALKEAEDMLSAAFDNASVGMAFTDVSGKFLKVNAAYAALTGHTTEDFNNIDFYKLTHPGDIAANKVLYDELVAGNRSFFNLAKRYIHKDGDPRWIQVNVTRLPGATGNSGRMLVMARDINTEVNNAKALAESQAMFKNITSSAPTGLWLSDKEGGLIYLNETLVQWTGMPYNDLLGAGWANAIIEEDRQRGAQAFMTAIAARSHYDVMFRIRKGTGEVAWCRAAGDPYYDEEGNYMGYAGFCMDVNELVDISDELKSSEARLRSIVEQSPMAIGVLRGKDMVVEMGNPKIFEIWGKDTSITGKPIIEALPEIEGQMFMGLLKEVYETGVPFLGNGVLARLERYGELRDMYLDFVYTPLRAADDSITGIMVLATEVTEQFKARKAIEESEAKFRSLIQEAPVATCLFVGREMKVELANDLMLGYWGKDRTAINKPLDEALPELKGQPFLQLLDDVYTTGIAYRGNADPVDLEVNGVLSTYYFDFTYKPIADARGEIYAVLNMSIDVTAKVLAQRQLEESELFSRSIIYNSPVAKVVLVGKDMMIRTVNENMLSMLGRDAAIVGKTFMGAMPELISTPLQARLEHVFATGETYMQPEEKITLIKHGVPYDGYYNYIYKALTNTAGEIYGIIITATDVTEQVLSRQRVEEAQTSLQGAIELAELGTWELDLQTRILDYSPRLRDWFGIDEDEVITVERAYNPIVDEHRPLVSAAMQHALAPGTDGIYDVEYRVSPGASRKERILHAQGKAFYNEKGEVYKIRGTAQDVTGQRTIQLALEQEVQQRTEELQMVNEELVATNEELHESNDRLVHSNEELAQYAYVASHDLQEPLRKIMLYSGMLQKDRDFSAEENSLIAKIGQSTERMSMLIKDLLEFSRLLKSETLMRPVDLALVVNAVTEDFELTILEKNATVYAGQLPVVEAVALQMNQLFYNLLNNALKFTRPGVAPVITIDVKEITADEAGEYIQKPEEDIYYHITVADNGIGFDVKYSEQIFEIFKRLHGRSMYPGSGIGLALCKRIVTNHNGHMFAESVIGLGSTFHIIMPRGKAEMEEGNLETINTI